MKPTPSEMARIMLGFTEQDWRIFLSVLRSELNDEDSDWEGVLFFAGQRLRESELGTLSMVLNTLRAGATSPRKQGGKQA